MVRGLSAFDICAIAAELQDLVGAYVEKVYQLAPDELLLRVKVPRTSGWEQLFIRNESLVCRTDRRFETPETPSVFAMTLRKYLQNGRLQAITQHEFDRILVLAIAKGDCTYRLILELFAHGNIILVGPDNAIIRPLTMQEWARRTIRSGQVYVPPPVQPNPLTMSKEAFQVLLASSTKDLVRTLASAGNLSGLYAEELCVRATIDKNAKAGTLSADEFERLYEEFQRLVEAFRTHQFHPVVVREGTQIVDVLPLPFQKYQGLNVDEVPQFCKGLELFIDRPAVKPLEHQALTARHDRFQRQLTQQQERIAALEQEVVSLHSRGNLLSLHLQPLDALLKEIARVLRSKDKTDGLHSLRRNPLVSVFDPEQGTLIVRLSDSSGRDLEVPLDFRRSAAANAQAAYAEGKKSQEKLAGAKEALAQTLKDIGKVADDLKAPVHHKQRPKQRHWWFEQYRWFITTDGNVVVGGRDARSNDQVVKKYLAEGDRYIHADIHGAPSCIVKQTGIHGEPIPISERSLRQACIFAASYSRAWSQFAEAQTYWVLPEQVSKTAQSGEYVPKGAFIIRGKRNYEQCTLQLAIGCVDLDGEATLMGGPEEAVKVRSSFYVVVVPGTMKKQAAAKVLAKRFQVATEEVDRVLPPGNVRIDREVGGAEEEA